MDKKAGWRCLAALPSYLVLKVLRVTSSDGHRVVHPSWSLCFWHLARSTPVSGYDSLLWLCILLLIASASVTARVGRLWVGSTL